MKTDELEMTKRKRRTQPAMVNVDEDGDKKIVRDNTFSRAVVDQVLPIPLSKDLELSCIQVSPILNGTVDHGERFGADLENVWVEVARIRIGYPEALSLAMHILRICIDDDRVHGDKVAESVLQWTRAAAEAANEDQETKNG